jgi:hypothetical protein
VALLERQNIAVMPKIEEGDAGVILKKNGEFVVFNTHGAIDPDNLTDRQVEQGQQLLGIAAALRVPQLMEVLLKVANDPTVFEQPVDVGAGH